MCLFLQLRDLHAMLPYLKHLKFLKSLDMRYLRLLAARVEHIVKVCLPRFRCNSFPE